MDRKTLTRENIRKMIAQTITSEQLDDLKKSKHIESVKFDCVPQHLPNYKKYTVSIKGWGDMSVYTL